MAVRLPFLGSVTHHDFGAVAFIILALCFLAGMSGYLCGCSDPTAPTVSPLKLCEGKKSDEDEPLAVAEDGAVSEQATTDAKKKKKKKDVDDRQRAALERHASKGTMVSPLTKTEKLEQSLERKRSAGNVAAGSNSFNKVGGKKGSFAGEQAKAHAEKKKKAMERAKKLREGTLEGDDEEEEEVAAASRTRSGRYKDKGTHV